MMLCDGNRGWLLIVALIFGIVLPVCASAQQEPAGARGAVSLAPKPSDLKPFSKQYALIVGIDKYEQSKGWRPLKKAVEDAKAVAAEFERRGFEVITIFDKEATKARIVDALERLLAKAGNDADARVFIWFAGHGHTKDGREYILPVDAEADNAAMFLPKAIRLSYLTGLFREFRSRHLLAVFDSCFSGSVHFVGKRSATPPAPADIKTAMNNQAHQLISSGVAGQEVRDDGKFRELFLAAIRGERPEADRFSDGFITSQELAGFLKRKISIHSREQQTPHFTNLPIADRLGSFVFRTGKGVDPGKRVALVVGNSKYSKLDVLANPKSDAAAVATLLQQQGFRLVTCGSSSPKAGAAVVPGCFDLDRRSFEDALEHFGEAAEGSDLALFFYAGHGFQTSHRARGIPGNMLAPVDMSFDCKRGTARRKVPLEEVVIRMEAAKEAVVILDASRNVRCTGSRGIPLTSFGSFGGFHRSGSLVLISSTLPGEIALDGQPGKHSPFAAELIRWFKAAPTTDFSSLLSEVASSVHNRSRKVGFRQSPQLLSFGGLVRSCVAGINCSSGRRQLQGR